MHLNSILTIVENERLEKLSIHIVIKDAFLRFIKTFFYNYMPYNEWLTDTTLSKQEVLRDMCFFWEDLTSAHAYRTVASWQYIKQKTDVSNDDGTTRDECYEANKKFREVILNYFAFPLLLDSELLYGSEGKIYKAEQINPLLQRTIERFQLVYAVHKA